MEKVIGHNERGTENHIKIKNKENKNATRPTPGNNN